MWLLLVLNVNYPFLCTSMKTNTNWLKAVGVLLLRHFWFKGFAKLLVLIH
jgi:hypothetical protein